jgi:hypothetical protein
LDVGIFLRKPLRHLYFISVNEVYNRFPRKAFQFTVITRILSRKPFPTTRPQQTAPINLFPGAEIECCVCSIMGKKNTLPFEQHASFMRRNQTIKLTFIEV